VELWVLCLSEYFRSLKKDNFTIKGDSGKRKMVIVLREDADCLFKEDRPFRGSDGNCGKSRKPATSYSSFQMRILGKC